MKITVKRDSFLPAFQAVAVVAPTRSPKTILQNVKISATSEKTELAATDTEIGIKLEVPDVQVETPGSAVISVQRLSMILRESTEDELHIESDTDKTLITGAHSRFELAGHNPDEFPEIAGFDEENYYQLGSGVLKELIHRTLFATDTESSRYALGGVLMEFGDDMIVAVGTDGRRLAKMEGPIKRVGSPDETGTTIVPAKAMQLLERILDDGDTTIDLAARANDLIIRQPNGVFYSRLVEGRYPKWREVLPKRTNSTRVDIPVGPLYSALRQAAIVASEESRGIDFTFKDGSLVLTNTTAEVGQSRIEMPVPFSEGELTITLDHRYLADFLRVLEPDKTFTFDLENSDKAAYCITDDNYGYVIMPLSRDRR